MTEHDDIDGLAAEYVLGTLDVAERRQVSVLRQTDAALAAAIQVWERRLGPLNEEGGGVEPPPHVLDGIVSRISSQAPRQSERAQVVPLRRATGRRRAIVAGASVLAACLVLAVGWLSTQQPSQREHSKMDCGKLYKDFWQTRDRESYTRLAPERLAGISRMALRAFDACQAGDEQDAKALLARLLGQSGERGAPSPERRAAVETKPRT